VARGEEVAAGRASFAGAYPPGLRGLAIRCFHGDGVDLVAGNIAALVLEDQVTIVGGKVSLSILAPEGELANVAQRFFAGKDQRIRFRSRRFLAVGAGEHNEGDDRQGSMRKHSGHSRLPDFRFPAAVAVHFRCSSVTLAVTGRPSRRTFTSTTSPTLLRRR